MKQDFRKEEKIENAYDSQLMKRLLNYSKPYWKILLLCILLLVIVTAVNLARPYLIKVAIDNHINALDTPMVAFNKGESNFENRGIEYRDRIYVRETNLKDNYVSVRADHNHSIPNHFITLTEDLCAQSRQISDDNADLAVGIITSSDKLLDYIEDLYEKNEYSVMLRRLRG